MTAPVTADTTLPMHAPAIVQRVSQPFPQTAPHAVPAGPRPIDSAAIFGGATEVHIRHGDAVYRLKQTSLGKLILTK